MNFKFLICGISAIALLSACNSGGGSDPVVSTSGPTTPSLKDLVEAGTPTNVSNAMSILVRDRTAQTTMAGARQTVSVTPSKNAAGDVVIELTALGRTVSFAPSDLNSTRTEYMKTLADGTEVYLWTYDGTWDDVANGTSKFKYMARIGTSDVVTGNVNNRAYGVLGSRTSSVDLPTTGTATYAATDGLRADFYDSSGSNSRSKLTADVNISMDFANSQISGEFNNLRFGNGTTEPGSIQINPATVSDGAFSSDLSLVGMVNGETVVQSSINGAFFGDEAQEVGGDMSLTLNTGGATNSVGAGVFGATKQ